MDALLLLLLDSRSPAGGHNHSAGIEPAIAAGWVRDLADVEEFCRGRLATSARVAAGFAAAACRWQLTREPDADAAAAAGDVVADGCASRTERNKIVARTIATWLELDAEFDARTPSEAVRAASRQLGSGLRRLTRSVLPGFAVPTLAHGAAPHHPVLLGAAIGAAGGTPELAAHSAALNAISTPAGAAVRLLGLDPFATQQVLARLAREISQWPVPDLAPADLPADGAPALDLLADYHLTTEVRLFAS